MAPRCQLLSGSLSTPRTFARASHATQRLYSTAEPEPVVQTPRALRQRKGGDLGSHLPKHIIPPDAYIPPYPYGDRALFKQANRGLYGEQMIHFGNNVSDKTETKTRRYWKPNVLHKSVYSVALKKKIKLRITAKVLKTMDREGGLDKYLLRDNEARVKELGPLGWALRWTLMQKPEIRNEMRAKAAALGIDQATIDAQWPTEQMLAEQKTEVRNLVKASELIPEQYEEGEEEIEVSERVSQLLTRDEKRLAEMAGPEYDKTINAATRYLQRGNVASEEDGIKLAFVRERERTEANLSLKQAFQAKLKEQFSDQDVAETRTRFNLPVTLPDYRVRTIAYNQQRRREIDAVGSYDAWRDKIDAEKAASGTPSTQTQEERKADYAAAIAEAESAATNMDLPHDRRRFLEYAIIKANMAIAARAEGGKNAYINKRIEFKRGGQLSNNEGLRRLWRRAAAEHEEGGDAWGALVDASNKSGESQARV